MYKHMRGISKSQISRQRVPYFSVPAVAVGLLLIRSTMASVCLILRYFDDDDDDDNDFR